MPARQSGTLPPKDRPQMLHRKLALGTVLLVVVPTLAYTIWLARIARQVMSDTHARNVSMLGQTLGAALAGRLDGGWSDDAADVLEGLSLETRLAFIAVTDVHSRPLHHRIVDSTAKASFDRWLEESRRVVELDRPLVLGEAGDLIAIKVPVWNPPASLSDHQQSRPPDAALEGFVLLALREPSLAKSLADLRRMLLTAALVMCLISLPVVIFAVRRWTAPLRALLEATIRLASGSVPQPVEVKTADELGQLAIAFNDMAQKLHTARHELQLVNEHLERKVEHRTAELQLVNERLASEVQEKNEFLRSISHDLAAPLRNISGMATMLLYKYRPQLGDDAVNKLERINANVRAQGDLLSDLLELSRIRLRVPKSESVDVQAVLERLRDQFDYDLESNQIILEIKGTLPTIIADPNRVRQLFQNLLDNAIKYMLDAPRRLITVSWCESVDTLEFAVTDTGCGIDSKDLPNVFQVFRRAKYSKANEVPGRGVGLANVKSIVECYGGRVWVESQPHEGTTVFFSLDRRMVGLPVEAVAA